MQRIRNKGTDYIYSDLDLTFNIHPIKHDLVTTKDINAIFKSIRNLLFTLHYERPFHPEKGSNVLKMLFENSSNIMNNVIEKEIFDTLTNFEPRIKLVSINVYSEENTLFVDIVFYMINSTEQTTITIPLTTIN